VLACRGAFRDLGDLRDLGVVEHLDAAELGT
jgi:hypothetical protein